MKKKGLLAVFTGNGKGKTTSALGLAFRALGHDHKVCIIQFIKGSWKYGEMISAEKFKENLDFHIMGRGFTWKSDDLEKDKKLAIDAWEFAKKIIKENKYKLVILDEFTYLLQYKMVVEEDVVDFLKKRPLSSTVVITGRYASEQLINLADLVTEMKEVKHHYKQGRSARKGIEY